MAGVAWEIASFSPSTSNISWIACGIISSATGIGLFIWLMNIKNRNITDWSKPFSVMKPFFPMNKNPVQFWLLTAISLFLGGLAAFLKEIVSDRQQAAFGATFLFMGIAIFLALFAAKKFSIDRN
ncbi:hypothetical protein [Salinisphaera sp.]|uniref:hypothetical protein n=1 Tax=Salinisphaera sp. TaxID=1914330 RepID=UPI002D77D8AF|nr:hypothetical protein [Salinisphaera sp.]HET7313096.1 hypothetical protein [Salinisphaera sp.]